MIREGRSFSGREKNCVFLNTGPMPDAAGKWANISAVSGFDFADDGRALGMVDWDHDGDLDAWVTNRNAPRLRFLRNDLSTSSGFVSIRLIGNGEQTNRDAIGARAQIILQGQNSSDSAPQRIKTVIAGSGFLSQSSKWLHFGLASGDKIDHIIVDWNGRHEGREIFRGLQANRHYQLQQGTGSATDVSFDDRNLSLQASAPTELAPSNEARIRLKDRLLVPPIAYQSFDRDEAQLLPTGGNKHLLVNLWSSQCRPCLQELTEFTARASELRAANIDILAINVDQLSGETSDVRADQILRKLKFPFNSGRAQPNTIAGLQHLHDFVVPLQVPLPLPASFLIDKNGKLNAIYKGKIGVDHLLDDVRPVAVADGGLKRSAFLDGETLSPSYDSLAETRRRESFRKGLLFADALRQQRKFGAARTLYEVALRSDPNSAPAHNNLGVLCEREGRLQAAVKHYREVLRIEPENASAHNNLGRLFRTLGQTDQAKTHFEQALHSNADMFEAHNNLGILLANENDWEAAKKHLERAQEIRPENFEVNFNIGEVCAKLGQLDDALRYLTQASRIRPNNAQVQKRVLTIGRELNGITAP